MSEVREVYCVGETKNGECGKTFYIPIDNDRFFCHCPFCGAELDLTLTKLDGVNDKKYELNEVNKQDFIFGILYGFFIGLLICYGIFVI